MLTPEEQRARELAESATKGTWEADLDLFDVEEPEIQACVSNDYGLTMLFTAGTDVMCESREHWSVAENSQAYKDAEFIAATDPQFIFSVLTRLEEALEENEKLKDRAAELEESVREAIWGGESYFLPDHLLSSLREALPEPGLETRLKEEGDD